MLSKPLATTRSLAICYLLFTICYLLISCSKLGDIRIVGQNFEDEIQLAQNLVFTFNKDIAAEADLNSWEATKFDESHTTHSR